MRAVTLRAFSDELVKTGGVMSGLKGALSAGWHGVGDVGSMTRQTWKGQGLGTATERAAMGPVGRGIDTATSLGGLTRHLPVGAKSMMAVGTALQARDAMKKEDPMGQERSRAERLSGLAGATAGGVLGVGAALRTGVGRRHPLLANLVGGIGGSVVGQKLTAAPWAASRRRRQAQQQAIAQQQAQQPQPGEVTQ